MNPTPSHRAHTTAPLPTDPPFQGRSPNHQFPPDSPAPRAPRRRSAGRLAAAGLAVLVAGLAACAGYGPRGITVGQGEDEVRRSMGEPTGRYMAPGGGTRLEYARGPMGRHTYMIDLDSGGRVARVEQVLNEKTFSTIVRGQSTDEVLQRIGRPADRRSVGWQGHVVWSWRFESPFCVWFEVEFGSDMHVVDGGSYGPDPECDESHRMWPMR